MRGKSRNAPGFRPESAQLTVLDLFSGIGGFSLGLERAGMRTTAFCEIDPFCQSVLAKHWPATPVYPDITKLEANHVGQVDIVCGGFPCQDISVAGKRIGPGGRQSGLWTELCRLAIECSAKWVIIENVGHTWRNWVPSLRQWLHFRGLATLPLSVRASGFGAVHNRHRVFVVAHADSECLRQLKMWWCGQSGQMAQEFKWSRDWSPGRLGADDGIPDRVDRCKALGNSVLPQITESIGRAIVVVESTA